MPRGSLLPIDSISPFSGGSIPQGGNPDQVLLFGESSGGTDTAMQLLSQKSWGLYQRAGLESGAFFNWAFQPMSSAEK